MYNADALSALLKLCCLYMLFDTYLHLDFCLAGSLIYLYFIALLPVLRLCVASIMGSLEAFRTSG